MPRGAAGQPGVQHDALAHVETTRLGSKRGHLGDHLVPGHVGERREGGHRVVDVARVEVAEHELGIGAADTREDRAGHHPVRAHEARVLDVVQAEGHAGQHRLQVVYRCRPDLVLGGRRAKEQRLHEPDPSAAPPAPSPVKARIPSMKASMSDVLNSMTPFMSGR